MKLLPIATVRNKRITPTDDNWGEVESIIELDESIPADSLTGLNEFSHIEVIFYFDKVKDSKICFDKRRPRNNPEYSEIGIYAQRGKNRPNKIGATICRLIKVEGNKIYLTGLDAIDGTPVLDIKPVFKEYLPADVKQPDWVSDLMKKYW